MKRQTMIFLVALLMVICSVSVIAFAADHSNLVPEFLKPDHSTPPPEGEPMYEAEFNLVLDEKVVLTTTIGDYFANKDYYQRKFGFGEHWRETHEPIEPQEVKYYPHWSLQGTDYPKYHNNTKAPTVTR